MKIIKKGREKLACPECGSEEVIKTVYLKNWLAAFVDIFCLGESSKVKKCMECKCIFKE